jgi:hypothetical protein
VALGRRFARFRVVQDVLIIVGPERILGTRSAGYKYQMIGVTFDPIGE